HVTVQASNVALLFNPPCDQAAPRLASSRVWQVAPSAIAERQTAFTARGASAPRQHEVMK
ncbi:hypothetical protein, partial [Pseudomonas sp. AH2 (2023)]|uniref:hypothetical protein n=1 Tax=Pseudomonas sp. AH2 (2023) TaxID=3048599 RepID=UPI002B2395B7